MCVCVCVCVCEREKGGEGEKEKDRLMSVGPDIGTNLTFQYDPDSQNPEII